MLLIKSSTSPFGRLAHVALIEAGFDNLQVEVLDPWSDPAKLLNAHPSRRVPVLVTDEGSSISESLLIAQYAERHSSLDQTFFSMGDHDLEVLGLAVGVLELSVNVIICRKAVTGNPMDTQFDETEMGLRRFASINDLLKKLEQLIAEADSDLRDNFSRLAAVNALNYTQFRFPEAPWHPELMVMNALSERLSTRRSLSLTRFT
ncbi:MAG: glutathione S-transferase N-terminal domain-containing protein [Litoreibacter sp.]